VDVQDQVARPSGERAKFSYGPCCNRDAGFNFDPQVVAVAEEMLLHRLHCLDRISRHVGLSRVSPGLWVASCPNPPESAPFILPRVNSARPKGGARATEMRFGELVVQAIDYACYWKIAA
jgi:hypothetical protein